MSKETRITLVHEKSDFVADSFSMVFTKLATATVALPASLFSSKVDNWLFSNGKKKTSVQSADARIGSTDIDFVESFNGSPLLKEAGASSTIYLTSGHVCHVTQSREYINHKLGLNF